MYYIYNNETGQFMYRGAWTVSKRQAYKSEQSAKRALSRYIARYGHNSGGTWMSGAIVLSHFDKPATW